jgi:hypothetical protein
VTSASLPAFSALGRAPRSPCPSGCAARRPRIPEGRGSGSPRRPRAARRAARHRQAPGVPLAQDPQAGYRGRLAPAAVPLDGHKPQGVLAAVGVAPDGRAAARPGRTTPTTRRRPCPCQGRQAGHLDRRAPDAVPLDGHEPPPAQVTVAVVPASRAAARRGARNRADLGLPAGVQGRQAGHRARRALAAVPLDGHGSLKTVVLVVLAGRAAARRAARHGGNPGLPALVQGPQTGHLDRPAHEPAGRASPMFGALPFQCSTHRVAPDGCANDPVAGQCRCACPLGASQRLQTLASGPDRGPAHPTSKVAEHGRKAAIQACPSGEPAAAKSAGVSSRRACSGTVSSSRSSRPGHCVGSRVVLASGGCSSGPALPGRWVAAALSRGGQGRWS